MSLEKNSIVTVFCTETKNWNKKKLKIIHDMKALNVLCKLVAYPVHVMAIIYCLIQVYVISCKIINSYSVTIAWHFLLCLGSNMWKLHTMDIFFFFFGTICCFSVRLAIFWLSYRTSPSSHCLPSRQLMVKPFKVWWLNLYLNKYLCIKQGINIRQ